MFGKAVQGGAGGRGQGLEVAVGLEVPTSRGWNPLLPAHPGAPHRNVSHNLPTLRPADLGVGAQAHMPRRIPLGPHPHKNLRTCVQLILEWEPEHRPRLVTKL